MYDCGLPAFEQSRRSHGCGPAGHCHSIRGAGSWGKRLARCYQLGECAFSIPIAEELQEQFAFSWEGQQYTFTVLPQGYLHSPTISHGIVAQHLGEVQPVPKV